VSTREKSIRQLFAFSEIQTIRCLRSLITLSKGHLEVNNSFPESKQQKNRHFSLYMERRRGVLPVSLHSTLVFFHSYRPFSVLSLNVLREVANYLSTYRYLPAISKRHLLIYDLELGTKNVIPLGREFPITTRLCLFSEWTALIFGSRTDRSVSQVDLRDCQLVPAASLMEAREDPGAIGYQGDCYLFGGRGDRSFLKTAEKLGKWAGNWAFIGEMAVPGFTFTPCIHRDHIYLPIANSRGKTLQSYHPLTNTYQTHSLRLCQPGNSSVCTIYREELVVVTGRETVGRWTLGSLRTETELVSAKMEYSNGVGVSTFPVLKGRFLYWTDKEKHLTKFDLQSCNFLSLPDFSHRYVG